MHRLTLLLLLALGSGLIWTNGSAQNAGSPENYYIIYNPLETGTILISGELILRDQFGTSQHSSARFVRFANPVDQNSEGIPNPSFHQTWWEINDPQNLRTVEVVNQFGSYTWTVGDGSHLVLPALKNNNPPEPPPPDVINHYKCYEATGPTLDADVVLDDQFSSLTTFVGAPRFLCNPVEKQFEGRVSPIVDPNTHLACYQIDIVHDGFFPLRATDQFGSWSLTTVETSWLCVPSMKMEPVPTETSTWGRMKSIYR